MSIKPVCDKCKNELQEPGALLFSPPDEESKTIKTHLCVSCYQELIKAIK